MSSTDLDEPPLKLILAAIIIVVSLHVLTAVALVAIKTPEIKVEPKKDTPPIEIEMVTLPPPPSMEVEEEKPQTTRKVDIKPKPKPKPKTKPAVASKPKAVQKSKPIEKSKPAVKPAVTSENPKTKTQPNTTKALENEPFEHEVKRQESISAVQAADNERKMMVAQAEKAAHDKAAQAEKAAKEAQRLADAKAAQVKADAKKSLEIADAKAKAEADARAAKVAADARENAAAQAAAAASNTPVDFTATDANWMSRPNFSFPTSAARRAKSGDRLTVVLVFRVNKQGGIDNVSVAQSSGNSLLDQAAKKQANSGKFKPFTEAGVPVVGNATLSIDYVVP